MESTFLVSVGHTAAGKTSLLRHLAATLSITFIEEAKVKREMLGRAYTPQDSLDEELRDQGYNAAINQAIEIYNQCGNVILEASFHKLFRRLWIYEKNGFFTSPPVIIWLNCYCKNLQKIERRINDRYHAKVKTAENQADHFFIYEHIVNNFDLVRINDFPASIRTTILDIDTDLNQIKFNASNFCNHSDALKYHERLLKIIENYLERMEMTVPIVFDTYKK